MGDGAVHNLGHTEDSGTNQSGGSGSPKPSWPHHQWDKGGARAWWPGAQDGQKAVVPGEDSRRGLQVQGLGLPLLGRCENEGKLGSHVDFSLLTCKIKIVFIVPTSEDVRPKRAAPAQD